MITDFKLPPRDAPLNIAALAVYGDQFVFQQHHSIGSILNIGCNTDGADLWKNGAINVDLYDVDPESGNTLPVHIIADARNLPEELHHRFDTVVLGEILEHMEPEDAFMTLMQARFCLKELFAPHSVAVGRIVITIPHDGRRDGGTLEIPERKEYVKGVHAYHYRKIEREEVFGWLERAQLRPIYCAEIRYPWGGGVVGSGIVAVER